MEASIIRWAVAASRVRGVQWGSLEDVVGVLLEEMPLVRWFGFLVREFSISGLDSTLLKSVSLLLVLRSPNMLGCVLLVIGWGQMPKIFIKNGTKVIELVIGSVIVYCSLH